MKNNSMRLIAPGLVFVSVVTGGAFATGREIVQFFVRHGTTAWLGAAVALAGFGVLFYLTAESARHFETYDYRRWARHLLPRHSWILLDILYIAMAVLVSAIVISAAASLLEELSIMPAVIGGAIVIAVSTIVIGLGTRAVISLKSAGAALLIITYCLAAITLWLVRGRPSLPIAEHGWLKSGLEYVGYNTVALPACLYACSKLRSRRDSAIAATYAAAFMMLPVACLILAIAAGGAEAIASTLPLHSALRSANSEFLLVLYYVVFVWTLIDTAVGMVFAFLDRLDSHFEDAGKQTMSLAQRSGICLLFLLASIGLSRVGIVALVAKGYVVMSYLFIITLVLPLLWFGIRSRSQAPPSTP